MNCAGGTTGTGNIYGINLGTGQDADLDVYNDTMSITGAVGSKIFGINSNFGTNGAGNTINFYNNLIQNCDIRDRPDAAGVPANGIYSSGSGGAPNGANTIQDCKVFNWTSAGLLLSASCARNGWYIHPSWFYENAGQTTPLT